jgi:Lsr2
MARVTTFVDDLDGSANAETVSFGFGGKAYEIDLSKKNRTALEKLLSPYIDAARRPGHATVVRTSRPRAGRKVGSRREELSAVREWARQNGWPNLGERGRIPGEVEAAYDAAH